MNARLPADRRTEAGTQRTYRSTIGQAFPDGTITRLGGETGLRWRGQWLPWGTNGYGAPRRIAGNAGVEVLTPHATVMVLQAGYRPVLHPSAE